MDNGEKHAESSSDDLTKSADKADVEAEKDVHTDAHPTQRKWYPGKYMGLNKKAHQSPSNQQTPEHEETDGRESISSERPSEVERRSSLGRLSSGSNTSKPGWYPGKYMGIKDRRKSNASDEADAVDSIMDTGEEPAKGQTTWSTYGAEEDSKTKRSMSTWLSSFSKHDADSIREEQPDGSDVPPRAHSTGTFSNWFRRSGGTNSGSPSSSSKDLAAAEDPEAEKDEQKKEAMITRTVRCIRNKFIDRQLHGRILIYRTSGVVTTAVLCEVNAMEIKSAEVTAEEIAALSYNDRRAITMTDTVLNSLERRSRAWDGCDFADEVFLTRGMFIGVSDPFVGMIGFSIQVDFTCTIKSLLASRKRFEAKVKAEKEMAALMRESDDRGSFFSRSLSFSFSSGHGVQSVDKPPLAAAAFVNQPIVPVVQEESVDKLSQSYNLSDDETEDSSVKEV